MWGKVSTFIFCTLEELGIRSIWHLCQRLNSINVGWGAEFVWGEWQGKKCSGQCATSSWPSLRDPAEREEGDAASHLEPVSAGALRDDQEEVAPLLSISVSKYSRISNLLLYLILLITLVFLFLSCLLPPWQLLHGLILSMAIPCWSSSIFDPGHLLFLFTTLCPSGQSYLTLTQGLKSWLSVRDSSLIHLSSALYTQLLDISFE